MNNKNKLVFRFNNFLLNIEIDNNIFSIYYINDEKNIRSKMIEVDINANQFLHKEESIKDYIEKRDLKDYIILSMFIPSLIVDLNSVSYISKNASYELLLKIMLAIDNGEYTTSSDELMNIIRNRQKVKTSFQSEEDNEWDEENDSPAYKA